MTPITISGAVVDAEIVIDYLTGQVAEQALTIAVLRAQVASWSALAHAQVVDGLPDTPEPDRPVEGSPGVYQTVSGVTYRLTPDLNGS